MPVMARMKRSVPAPGEVGEMNSIGLDGYVCACADPATSTTAQTVPMSAEAARVHVPIRFMIPPRVVRILRPIDQNHSSSIFAALAPERLTRPGTVRECDVPCSYARAAV